MPDGIFGRFAEWVRKKLGLLRVFKVYMYVVRVSGVVMPPPEFRKKDVYKKETQIQFELSFEEEPYFRTLLDNIRDAQTRFESELRSLVKNQESKIQLLPYTQSPFSWSEKISADIITQTTINNFLKVATEKDKAEYETKRIVKIPAKPEFVVQAVDFEPVESFEVTEDKIKTFESIDTFIFKLYRPNEEEEYRAWRGEFLHAL